MTEGTTSWIQVAGMGLLCRMAGFGLRDIARCVVIQGELRVEPFLHLIEKKSAEVVQTSDQDASWLSYLGGFQACPITKRPWGRLRTCC